MLISIGKFFRKSVGPFVKKEDGLVTVEWVALSAAVVVGGITLVWLVIGNLKTPANSIGNQIDSAATTPVTQNAP